MPNLPHLANPRVHVSLLMMYEGTLVAIIKWDGHQFNYRVTYNLENGKRINWSASPIRGG